MSDHEVDRLCLRTCVRHHKVSQKQQTHTKQIEIGFDLCCFEFRCKQKNVASLVDASKKKKVCVDVHYLLCDIPHTNTGCHATSTSTRSSMTMDLVDPTRFHTHTNTHKHTHTHTHTLTHSLSLSHTHVSEWVYEYEYVYILYFVRVCMYWTCTCVHARMHVCNGVVLH